MKNIILAAALLATVSLSSFTPEKNSDVKLLKALSSTFEKTDKLSWVDNKTYRQAAFAFNNKTAYAFYGLDDNELIGYSFMLNKHEVPGNITKAIKDKYDINNITNALMFIDADGHINYYTQVVLKNKNCLLKITPKGKANVYTTLSKLQTDVAAR